MQLIHRVLQLVHKWWERVSVCGQELEHQSRRPAAPRGCLPLVPCACSTSDGAARTTRRRTEMTTRVLWTCTTAAASGGRRLLGRRACPSPAPSAACGTCSSGSRQRRHPRHQTRGASRPFAPCARRHPAHQDPPAAPVATFRGCSCATTSRTATRATTGVHPTTVLSCGAVPIVAHAACARTMPGPSCSAATCAEAGGCRARRTQTASRSRAGTAARTSTSSSTSRTTSSRCRPRAGSRRRAATARRQAASVRGS